MRRWWRSTRLNLNNLAMKERKNQSAPHPDPLPGGEGTALARSFSFQRSFGMRQRIGWCPFGERAINSVSDYLSFAPQFCVGIPKNFDSQTSEKSLALAIVRDFVGTRVPASVEFNGESNCFAKEVNRVWPDWMLPSKFPAVEASVPKPAPHQLFSPRCLSSQNSRPRNIGHSPILTILTLTANSQVLNPSTSECTKNWNALFPLPRGEGQGEGQIGNPHSLNN
jgi:hypothetical protein